MNKNLHLKKADARLKTRKLYSELNKSQISQRLPGITKPVRK